MTKRRLEPLNNDITNSQLHLSIPPLQVGWNFVTYVQPSFLVLLKMATFIVVFSATLAAGFIRIRGGSEAKILVSVPPSCALYTRLKEKGVFLE